MNVLVKVRPQQTNNTNHHKKGSLIIETNSAFYNYIKKSPDSEIRKHTCSNLYLKFQIVIRMPGGQFQDLCEFVEMAVFEDATYL